MTIHVPVNDHAAELNEAQMNWPRETLRNLTGDELLRVAASIRGYLDTHKYLVSILHTLPDRLEKLAQEQRRLKKGKKRAKRPDSK
jgi:hypothetical protein